MGTYLIDLLAVKARNPHGSMYEGAPYPKADQTIGKNSVARQLHLYLLPI